MTLRRKGSLEKHNSHAFVKIITEFFLTKIFAIILATSLPGCYLLSQAYVQSKRLLSARPISDVLVDPAVSQVSKNKLIFIGKVRDFARENGLKVGENYSEYIDLGSEPRISYLVSAAPEFKLEPKTWNYAFAGKFPYLGYFSKSDRDDYADFLEKKMKMDVYKGEAAAFSFLGWINDPVYSTMLTQNDSDLAGTLFHELTHSTLWIKNNVTFNEKLAEFVSELLLDAFDQSGSSARELRRAQVKADREKIALWIDNFKADLKKSYKETEGLDRTQRLSAKQAAISHWVNQFPEVTSHEYSTLNKKPWNNARLLALSLYTPDFSDLNASYHCREKLKVGDWLERIKRIHLREGLERSLELACSLDPDLKSQDKSQVRKPQN